MPESISKAEPAIGYPIRFHPCPPRGERPHLPFGSPEGDSANIDDAVDELVSFKGRRFQHGVGMSPDDRTIRVIVGRKGAGKTLYLRRLQDAADQEDSLYADAWQTRLFNSDPVLLVWEWYGGQAVERWKQIWSVATLRSLVSHVLGSEQLEVSFDQAERLQYDFSNLYPEFNGQASIYDQVTDILAVYSTPASLEQYLNHSRWSALSRLLGEILGDAKPVCFYLDALDEYFENAPGQWLLCQLGLFQAVMSFLGDPNLRRRLHIVIGVRDIVFSTRLASEHKTKYKRNPNIRTLDWSRDAIRHFLTEKLGSLDPSYLLAPEADRPIERWLGSSSIVNRRGEREGIEDYLLRHTRLIPRDIVELGNMLCRLIDKVTDFGQSFLGEEEIRLVVRQVAADFGEESLTIVAHHLSADAMPNDARGSGIADMYTGEAPPGVPHGSAMQLALVGEIKERIGALRVNRFGHSVRQRFEMESDSLMGGGPHFLDVLWQHGLLGYIDGRVREGPPVFYDAAGSDALALPRDHNGYALHSILIDAVPGLSGTGLPVGPSA